MDVKLVSVTQGVGDYEGLSPQEIIQAVARHGKIKEGNKLLRYLIEHKHWSPLEHVSFSFKIVTSRAISAQIFRHKSMHFQETSQRYEKIQSVEPIRIRRQAEKNRQSSEEEFDPLVGKVSNSASSIIEFTLKAIQDVYNNLIEAGVARECARMILPMASSTTIHVTGTLRDLLAFLNVRCAKDTQLELREIALIMGGFLEVEIPLLEELPWRAGGFM